MTRVLDIKCLNPACGFIYEDWVERNDKPCPCPNCDGTKYEIVFTQGPAVSVEKDAYDRFLHKRAPDDPIKSVVPKSFKGSRPKKKAAGS